MKIYFNKDNNNMIGCFFYVTGIGVVFLPYFFLYIFGKCLLCYDYLLYCDYSGNFWAMAFVF